MMSKLGRIVCNLVRRPQSKAPHTLAWLGDELEERKHLCAQWETTPAASLNAGAGEEFRPHLGRLACNAIADFLSEPPKVLAWVMIDVELPGLLLNLGGQPSW
jgi:hypothetical protein